MNCDIACGGFRSAVLQVVSRLKCRYTKCTLLIKDSQNEYGDKTLYDSQLREKSRMVCIIIDGTLIHL